MIIALLVAVGVPLYGAGMSACWALVQIEHAAFMVCWLWPVTIPALLTMRIVRTLLTRRERLARLEAELTALEQQQWCEIVGPTCPSREVMMVSRGSREP